MQCVVYHGSHDRKNDETMNELKSWWQVQPFLEKLSYAACTKIMARAEEWRSVGRLRKTENHIHKYLCSQVEAYLSVLQVSLFQKLATSAEHLVYQNCSKCQNKTKATICVSTQHVLQVLILSLHFSWTMNNLLSYCGLVSAKIRASDKDLPVLLSFDFQR